ncbi:MAG: transposase [Muricauda sp.]|nr:site-specific integrase [Allomuricauda sp.]MBC30763.1 transposase [Allomuricauda sp.]|tara:strand:+ start:35007 stop:36284 length:1278 start_codon:yes stop_codon:yes gene_type:complete
MKVSTTFSIHFWLKKKAQKINGEVPIYIRITVDGVRADISLKRSTLEKNWCPKSARIRPRRTNAKSINAYLDGVKAKILDCHKQLHDEGILITANAIKLRYLGKDKPVTTLRELLDYHEKKEKPKLKPGTAKNYTATEKYLLRFLKKKYHASDVKLARIDCLFLEDFDQYLRSCSPLKVHQPLTNNGIMKHMERFKKIVNIAFKYSWIKQNPFALYQLKFEDYESDFLEDYEIALLESLKLSGVLEIARDTFVFSCYTGLSYIEVKLLKKKDIVQGIDGEDWISVRREKTNTPVKVPLLDKARKIIDKYARHPKHREEDTLLPIFSNQRTNQYLKMLSQKAGIKKHLTFHVARHTFATTVTLLNDVPLETVSKLLGHTKLSTTQRYARVVERKISKDMKRLKSTLKTSNKRNYESTNHNHLQIVR